MAKARGISAATWVRMTYLLAVFVVTVAAVLALTLGLEMAARPGVRPPYSPRPGGDVPPPGPEDP